MTTLRTFAAIFLLTGCSFAQSLTVRPIRGNRMDSFARGGYIGLAISHGDRYGFLASDGLSIKETKAQYSKKDLEKLEAKGVKIIVTELADTSKVIITHE